MREIKEFKIGEIAESYSGMKYEILEYIFTVNNKKRQITSSRCKNTATGEIIDITWHKNCSFI